MCLLHILHPFDNQFFILRTGAAELVNQIVNNQTRMTPVPQYHTVQFGIDHCPDKRVVTCRMESSRLFIIEQSQLVRLFQNDRRTDGAMEVKHIQSHTFSYRYLLLRHFGSSIKSGGRPVPPTDGCTKHDTPSIQPQHRILSDSYRLKPTEAECLNSPIG